MATRKISELDPITDITSGDLLLVVDGETSTTKNITATNAANSIVDLATSIPTLVQDALDDKLNIADIANYNTAGVSVKTPVVAATTTNIPLATTGAGSGIDGVTLAAGNRLLVKNQNNAEENGIYIVGAANTPLTRATDFNTPGEIKSGYVLVTGGTTQLSSGWLVQTDIVEASFIVDTDDIVFVQFSAALVGLTAASVGLGNVNNTSDAAKPISTLTSTALNTKQNNITGGASTITSSNLTASKALVSSTSGKVEVSNITATELSYVSGVTSAVQTQINSKAALASPTFTGNVVLPTTTRVGTGTTTIESFLTPAGAVMTFAGQTAPVGWLEADGRELSRTEYSTLFAAIGTLYGFGNNIDTFNIPDLRGYFVRGAGTNSDYTASGAFGARQDQDWKGFSMTNTVIAGGIGSYNHGPVDMGKSTTTYVGNMFTGYWAQPAAAIGTKWDNTSEIRPKNIALLYCIKF